MSWDDEVAELQARIDALRSQLEPSTHEPLRVPSVVEFVLSGQFLAKPTLFPRQATLLRSVFLELQSISDYDHSVLADWQQGFVPGEFDELFDGRWFEPAPDREFTIGTTPDLFDRIRLMRERGRRSFKHVNIVAGRRASKGEVTAMAVAYKIWQLLELGEPQPHVHAARGKVLTVDVFAGNAQQARENAFADIVRTVVAAPCFERFVQSTTRDRLVIATPYDLRDPDRTRAGTIEVVARETTVLAGRGQTSVVQVFDEMAWVDPASSKAPADALYEAASPALDQARGWALVITISSPSQRAGKFYELHRQATEIDLISGTAAYPEMVTFQFASWSPYLDADDAETIPLAAPALAAASPWFVLSDGAIACFPANGGAPIVDDAELRQRQRADPRVFPVENGGQWADVADAFLEPRWVDNIFREIDGRTLRRQLGRQPGLGYVIHIDPSTRHDATACVIAHVEQMGEQRVVVIDLVRRWVPGQRDLDWEEIYDQIEHDIVAFLPRSITVDQYGGTFIVTELNKRVRKLELHQRIDISDVPHTRASNLSMGDIFREAVKRGHVRSYPDRQLELELRFLRDVNGTPKASTAGPVRTDDVAVAAMVVVQQLLGANSETHVALSQTSLRGLPSLNPSDDAIFDRFITARASGTIDRRDVGRPRTAPHARHRR